MGIVGAVLLIVLGLLGAASLIIAKKPEAKDLIDKLVPYQAYSGAIGAIWGIVIIAQSILNLGLLKTSAMLWVTYLAMGVVMFGLGLLLGVGLLKTWAKDETATAKMDEMVARLAPKQGMLGLISLGLGVWGLLAYTIM